MAFFAFNQNNSGGAFVVDRQAGIAEFVIVEASGQGDAIDRAEAIGLYFNGVDDGRDCECCGDRWYSPDGPSETPIVYGKPADEFVSDWTEPAGFIHFQDGRKQPFGHKKVR